MPLTWPSWPATCSIQPQLERIHRLSDAHDLIGLYVFCLQPDMPGRHAAARRLRGAVTRLRDLARAGSLEG